MGFFGAFRRSELVAIQWESVKFVPQGVEILLPRSKTDQTGEGTICAIPYGNLTLCPVRALQQWQEISQRSAGPIFVPISKKGTLASHSLSPTSINNILKNLASACQLPQADYFSSHSLRRGFATTATQKGASMGAIMRQGRWRHEATVHGYIEEGKRFERNAASAILSELDDLT